MTTLQTKDGYNPQYELTGVPKQETQSVFDHLFIPPPHQQNSFPALTEDEIDALCEEVKTDLRTNHPEVYAPCR